MKKTNHMPPRGPLSGLKVIEMGQNLAGPFAGEILADLGADVVKIEKPGGDDARSWGAPITENASAVFHLMNRNKASVALDLKDEVDLGTFHSLLADCDIFIHNMRPGAMRALALDGMSLSETYPSLIYCDMGAFGHEGPLRNKPGYEPLVQAFSGLVSINGHPDGQPARIGPSIVDLGTGMWTVIGALAALWQRKLTGRGCVVNTSLLETALVWSGSHTAIYSTTGKVPPRQASGHPMIVPYQEFQTAGGPLVVAPGNDRLFAALARALDHPEWLDDPRFNSNPARIRHREEIVGLVSDSFRRMSLQEARDRLDRAGVPNSPRMTLPEVLEDPQVAALDIYESIEGSDARLSGLPISFNGVRPRQRRCAPDIGEDTESRRHTPWPGLSSVNQDAKK